MQRNFIKMNVERVENMFDGVQEAFIVEMRKLKNELVKEFDASEKLEEINQKNELKRRQLEEENYNYEVKEKQLKNDLAIAQSLVEEKEKLIKALDPAGVGQRIIRSLNAEEIENLKKRIADLESKEKGLLETNTKLEAEKAGHVKTIDNLRKEVSAQKDRQATGVDCINELKEKIGYLESKDITQLETIDKLKSENADLQNQREEYAKERVTNLEAEMSLLKKENKKLKAAQSAKNNKSNDNSGRVSKRKAASAKTSQKRIKTRER